MNIVCFGDSITHAFGFAECDRWTNILQSKLEQWRPGRYAVYNHGCGGETAADGLDRFTEQILPLLPGVVIIEFGFNDANVCPESRISRSSIDEYRRNLREFHRMIKKGKGQTIFIVNHPAQYTGEQGNGKPYEKNFNPYNTAVRQLAAQLRAPAIDLPKMVRAQKIALKTFWADDRLHLSPAGNHIYAELVCQRLKEIL